MTHEFYLRQRRKGKKTSCYRKAKRRDPEKQLQDVKVRSPVLTFRKGLSSLKRWEKWVDQEEVEAAVFPEVQGEARDTNSANFPVLGLTHAVASAATLLSGGKWCLPFPLNPWLPVPRRPPLSFICCVLLIPYHKETLDTKSEAPSRR